MFSKKSIENNSDGSKKLYQLISTTEKKSALDYKYWEVKLLYQINNNSRKDEFEKNFISLFILSKNNSKKRKSLKLFYLRNVPRFSQEVRDIVMSET